ncbi:hypothetical protein BN1723_010621 [Verticillium longisporum]|uniref:Uncharacterized protein n=1 Tax=Verticillium longisporum TaxID=100787 RepID=A0A0G4KZW2_VERLO|nr:hypothetical protein BN1723_010621 [Verticillium longisporum]
MAGSKPSSPFGTFLIVGSVCFFLGILVLQVGQAYAERKELEEIEALDKKDKEAAAAAGKGGAANKKKQ